MSKLPVGITDGRMFDVYADWIQSLSDEIELVPLGYRFGNLDAFKRCKGIVFTGGEDVHPRYYGHLDYLSFCEPPDFDEHRDAFEFQLLEGIGKCPLPVLGICRGLQLINVFYGGSLIPDLPRWGRFNHAKLISGEARDHQVRVDPHAQLFRMVQSEYGLVNSLHHQSADELGKGLVAAALSVDGVVEAIEWKEPEGKAFLSLVQWHPERMDPAHPFAKGIGQSFLDAIYLSGQAC